MVHKVKSHRWNQGVLETMEYFFETELLAREFASQVVAHSVKIINHDNEVIDARHVSFNQKPIADYSGADLEYSGAETTYA